MLRLYDYELSGNCYKLRLLLHWLDLPCERVPVNFHPGREHKSADFLQHINPLGQLPVLADGEFLLRDAQACLVYLASRYDPGGSWYPDDAQTRGMITLWLASAERTNFGNAPKAPRSMGSLIFPSNCRLPRGVSPGPSPK